MKRFWCSFFIFWPIVAVLSCLFAPQRNWWFPGNREASNPLGTQIDDLFYLILDITTIVFIGTQIALGYVLWRGSQEHQERAWFTHGSHNLEVVWSIVPAGILLFVALYQMDVWANYRIKSHFPKEALASPIAEVTARQFEWRIRYPAPGRQFRGQKDIDNWLKNPEPGDLHTVNDLHVPTAKPVLIYLRSGDVQHSFFVPDFRVKQDAVPGQIIPIWWEVTRMRLDDDGNNIGYDLTCAELCGWGHYKMRGRVLAQSEDDFHEYLLELQAEQNYDGVAKPAPSLAQTKNEVQK